MVNSEEEEESKVPREEESFISSLKKSKDPLNERIGDFGKWQFLVGLVYGLTIGIFAWQSFANKFFSYPVNHSCVSFAADTGFAVCNSSCSAWDYDESLFSETVVKRWDLVCEYKHLPRVAQTITFMGSLVGALISGWVADKYGRRTLIIIGLSLLTIFGILGPMAPNFILWTFLRFMSGVAASFVNIGANVYFIEVLGGKWRSICSAIFGGIPFQLGQLTLGVLVYLVPNMMTAEYIIGAVALPCLLFWIMIPESPRWMLARGNVEEAEKIIKKISSFNGIAESPKSSPLPARGTPNLPSVGVMDLLKYPGIRRNFLIMCFNWFGFTLGFYGLVYNTPAFDFNIYLVFVFPTFFAIPLNLLIPIIENRFGRKPMITGSMLISGVSLLLSLALASYRWPVTVLSIFGTVSSFAAMSAGYIYCKELFPTVLRSTALSFSTVSARTGTLLSPLIGTLDSIHPAAPIGVYGIIALIAGGTSFWLWPETKQSPLPNTLIECQEMSRAPNGCCGRKIKTTEVV